MTEFNAAGAVIYLASCAVNGKKPDKGKLSSADFDKVFRIASRHMIGALIAFAVESAGIKDDRSAQAIVTSVRKTVCFDTEWLSIKRKFEDAGIRYAPLKGAVLKNDYPKVGMREFSDFDILIDPARSEDVKTILESLGYSAAKFNVGVHDVYFKEPFFNFEIHRSLFDRRYIALDGYYKNVLDRLTGEGFEKFFTSEDLYLYLVAHEYKHFSEGGTGLRSLLDIYVCLKKGVDMEYIVAEAKKMGISDFEQSNRSLALDLFDMNELTDSERKMLEYILASGTFGTLSHSVKNNMKKTGQGKIRYALRRFFVPFSKKNPDYDNFSGMYPAFYHRKILLPFLPFYRIFKSIKRGRFREEYDALKKVK